MTRDQQVPLTVMTWKIRTLIWNRNPELSNIFAYYCKIITTNNSKNNNWEWEAKIIIKKFSKSGNSCFYRTFGNWVQISRQFRVNLYIRHFSLNQQHNDRGIFVDRNPHWIFLSEEGIQFFCCMDWQHIRVTIDFDSVPSCQLYCTCFSPGPVCNSNDYKLHRNIHSSSLFFLIS